MSIQSEIERIRGNVQDSLDVCRDAGVSVASDANSNDLPGATRALASSFLPLAGGTVSGVLTVTGGAKISGRAAGGGDDEGIVIGRASNNYAGLCLGVPTGVRSVFYLLPDNSAKWRYVGSSGTASDIAHPGKAGTIALTDDLHSANKIEDGTVGIMASNSNEISFKSNANVIYFGYENRMGSAVPVDTYCFGTHRSGGDVSGKILCGQVDVKNGLLPQTNGGAALGANDKRFQQIYGREYYFENVNPGTSSPYKFGMYQWDNNFTFVTRNAANNHLADAWQINGATAVTNFSQRPTVTGYPVATQNEIPTNYLPNTGGQMTGHLYMAGANESSSTGSTSQIVFGTPSDNHVVLSSNRGALIVNPTTASTSNQIVLYLNQASDFPNGIRIGSAGQNPGDFLLRNSKLVSSDTNPTVNGEICWTYK